jgi:tetratricopeptide (TPR) repeat protein
VARLALAGWLLTAASAVAHGSAPVHADPRIEARIDRTFHQVTHHIYDGHLDSARVVVEEAARIAPGDPRISLMRFRVLREGFPDDINEEARARRLAPTLLATLDRAIASCDSILRRDKNNPAAYLYRGWGHMMKAQTHAIAKQIWLAGSESRLGKDDLDRYIQFRPDDPDAAVILGGYLYFSDILPRLVKFLKFLARIPAGNRERGLDLLAAGARGNGYAAVDAEVVLAVIDYLFEGRFDEASARLVDLAERFPYNPRLGELVGSTAILYPDSSLRAIEAQGRLIEAWDGRVRGWNDLFLYRMLWARARTWNQIGEYDAAREDLEAIVAVAPPDPYWLMPRALLDLATLTANLGEFEKSRAYTQRVLDNPDWKRYHKRARSRLDLRLGRRQRELFLDLARIRRTLFGREQDLERARQMIAEIRRRNGHDVRLDFLEAELDRRLGNNEAARAAFQAIVDQEDNGGFGTTRVMSLIRLGEIEIVAGRYDKARDYYKDAQDLRSGYTHLGNMIRGRLRYIEEASEAEEAD